MSNAGQAALGIVGGVVGWFIGGPTGAYYGFQIGYGIGTIVSPTQLPGIEGPRLGDVRTTTSQVGGPVMEVYGSDAVPGQVIWLGPVQEVATTEEVGGKGAPEQDVTTYTYFQSIAIGICRGPVSGIRRIWENGKLVYDARNRQDDESDEDYEARVLASNEYKDTFVFYDGSEDQEPDPTIELDKGVGNVPAFRGLAYIVYPDRQLLDEQGKRHPNFKFEVAPPAEQAAFEDTVLELRFEGDDESTDITDDSQYHHTVNAVGPIAISHDRSQCGLSSLRAAYTDDGSGTLVAPNSAQFGFGSADFTIECWIYADRVNLQALLLFSKQGFTTLYPVRITITEQGSVGAEGAVGVDDGTYAPGTIAYNVSTPNGVIDVNTWHHIALVRHGAVFRLYVDGVGYDDIGNPAAGLAPGTWFGALASNSEPVRIVGLSSNWGSGGAFYVDDFVWTRRAKYTSNFTPQGCAEAPEDLVTLADIVSDRCARVGLTEDYIDVTDLEEIAIPGYTITRVTNERGIIEPLRTVGFFDIVESGRLLKFVTRGKAPVRTLAPEDVGAYEYGQQPGPLVTTEKSQDVSLPRQIRVHYRAVSRDYEDGEQLSPTRLTTTAVNDMDVEIPVAIEDERAAQCAEILWSEAWAARWRHSFSVDMAQADLEPADVVLLPIDGRLERLRILSDSGALPHLRKIDAIRDDDGSYVSAAVAEAPNRPPLIVTRFNATDLLLLDLPALRVQDNDAGIYAAARPSGIGNRWNGAVIFRSFDGVSFSELAAITNQATTGTVVTPTIGGDWHTWDDEGELIVELDTGTLESREDADVLAGANALAVGAPGRWQIVQFANAEQISANQWRLTRLLHGRRGTEHLIGTTEAGDTFVLVSGNGIVRLPMTNDAIGTEGIYRAVTIGTSFTAGTETTLVGEGMALKPFSPVSLSSSVQSGGDRLITWIRRDRLGQELQSGTDIPMSEASLSFVVEIMSEDSEREVLRTLETTSESVLYSEADIIADFGTPPDSIYIRVYQVSAVVGRGTPAEGYV